MERENFLGPEITKVLKDAISDLRQFHLEAQEFKNGRMTFPQAWWVSRRQALGEILYVWDLKPELLHQALTEVLAFSGLSDLYPGIKMGLRDVLLYPLLPSERKLHHQVLAAVHQIETRYAAGGIVGTYSLAKARIALKEELAKNEGYFGSFSSIYSLAKELAEH